MHWKQLKRCLSTWKKWKLTAGFLELQAGKKNIHFILANNLIVSEGTKKLNSYIPCIAWGPVAERLSTLTVNTKLKLRGELHSREYKKTLPDGSFEFRVAHECLVKDFEIL